MSNSEDIDKSEEASPHKLERARDRGAFARSQDTTYLVLLFAATAMLFAIGNRTIEALAVLMQKGLVLPDHVARPEHLIPRAMAVASLAVDVITPILFIALLAAVVGAGAQARGVFSAEPLKPDFSRLNPAQGLKRLFALRSLLDLVRSLIKLSMSLGLIWLWAGNNIGKILRLAQVSPKGLLVPLISLTGELMVLFSLLYVFFAAMDWATARWDFSKQMRMSKKELKDEFKEREGDPRIKQRLRELRAETLRKARSLARVPAASAVVTNPTHYAVCLEYDQHKDLAPRVSAKGKGAYAQVIRTVARRSRVPVIENPPLARALYGAVQDGDYIAQEHYNAVAKIFLWLAATQPRSGVAPR